MRLRTMSPAHAYLWVVIKLVMEALPGALIWVGHCDIVGVIQLPQHLPQQGNAALKQWQNSVPKVEALLQAHTC